jgi:hypothetical protein
MPGDFFEKIDELKDQVGEGHLVGSVEVDQVYAAAQETGVWVTGPNAGKSIRNHPGGGGSHFLGGALLEGSSGYMEEVAKTVLDGGPAKGMEAATEKLGESASAKAPIEFGDLRESAHPTVTDDGSTVYDRPPAAPRLSDEQLDAKARGRTRGDFHRTYLPKDHPSHGTVHPEGSGG